MSITTTAPQSRLLLVAFSASTLLACNREPTRTDETSAESTPRATASTPAKAPENSPMPTVAFTSPLGSCEPSSEVTQMLSRVAETADSNGNGEIEKTEAYSAVDFLVGGFFFRADKNFDGSVSPEEGRESRRELLNRSPMLASLMKRVATTESSAALDRMADLLGIDYDKSISSGDMRDAGRQLVDEVFRLADQNRNGSLNAGEAQQASLRGLRSVGQSAFAASDTDGNQKLSADEFNAALDEPARLAFNAADTDKDGGLTTEEASTALSALTRRVWLPAPAQKDAAGPASGEKRN